MIIGTAGHIDHGKSALVQALTGRQMDTLKEEQRRGITLDLHFAHLSLDDGTVAGVVDVPGHERFVKEMVAGAGGIDAAILVVACDDSVMPQTREHFDICRLLGVRAGVIALTKHDLAPTLGDEWMAMVRNDIAQLVKDSFLEGAKVIACSARSGEGLTELRAALTALLPELAPRAASGPLFLPIDRAFTAKGFGAVVTGPLLSGELTAEAAVAVLPGHPGPLRVRGVQVHGESRTKASPGDRTAVNIPDLRTEEVSRGMVLVRHDEVKTSRMVDVELTALAALPAPLPARSRLLLHAGTAQVQAVVALLDREALAPGETCVAQLRFDRELAVLHGQSFILRGFSTVPGRGTTVAGGRILASASRRRRKGSAGVLQALAGADEAGRAAWFIRDAGSAGIAVRELFARTATPLKELQHLLDGMASRNEVALVDREKRSYVSTEVLQTLAGLAEEELQRFHVREPLKPGLSREELRGRLLGEHGGKLFEKVLANLIKAGKVEAEGDLLRLPGQRASQAQSSAGPRAEISARLGQAALSPPRIGELATELRLQAPVVLDVCRLLAKEGELCRVSEDMYFARAAVDDLRTRLLAHLGEHKEITTLQFKELVGQSRKYVIPLAEYFDREHVTLRVGEKRVARGGPR